MDLDIRSLSVINLTLQTASWLTVILLHFLRLTEPKVTRCWVAAGACFIAAHLFIALRPEIPLLLSVLGGNLFFLWGVLLIWLGVRLFLGRKPLPIFVLLLPLAYALPVYWLTVPFPSLLFRVALFYSAMAACLAGMGVELFKGRNKGQERARILLGSCSLGFGAVLLVNTSLVGSISPGADIFTSNLPTQITMLAESFFIVFYTSGLIILLGERLQGHMLTAQRQAERANQAKTRFLTAMSHELRTPVSAILGMVDITLQSPLSSEQRENMLVARHASRHLVAIVDDLLDITRIEGGDVQLEQVDFDLDRLFQLLKASLEPLATEKGVHLEVGQAPQEQRYLKGDPGRLRQVLAGVLEAAISHTSGGGVSLLVLPTTPPLEKEEGAFKTETMLIQNSGVGIPAATREQLARELAQAEDDEQLSASDTGLRLTLSRRMARLMGGDLRLEQGFMSGPTFHLTVRLATGDKDKAQQADAPALLPEQNQGTGLTVLLAEDQEANAFLMQRLVERLGHRLLLAHNGAEALELLTQHQCDLVFMDLEMPVMDGFEATRRIRRGEAGEKAQKLPIVAVTAHAFPEYETMARDVGMDQFLTKPIDVQAMQTTLAQLTSDVRQRSHSLQQDRQRDSQARQLMQRELSCEEQGPAPRPVVDREALLQRMDGDEELVLQLWRLFLQNTPALLRQLEQALQQEDCELLRTRAHALKGEAGNVGAVLCKDAARSLEEAASRCDIASVRKQIPAVRDEATKAMDQLRDLLSQADASQA